MRVMQGVGPDSRLWVLLLGLAIALAACGPTATPTIVPVRPAEGQAVVVVDVAPLRAGPGLDFAIVGSLTYGTVVTRVGVSPDGGWYQVTRTDPSAEMDPAWIKADFISSWTATPTPSPGPSRLPTTTPTLRPAPTPSIRATALGGDGETATPGPAVPSSTLVPTARPTAPAAVSPAVTALPAGNRAPVIGAVACDVTAIRVGETALCTCSASDPDGDPLSYEWFVDGFTTRVTAPTFTYRPVEAGQHMIRAVVRDSQGAESYQEMPLQVAPAIPTPLPPPTPTPMPTYVPSPTPIPPTPLPPPTPTEKPTSEPGLTPSPLPIIMPTRSWPTSQAGGW